MPNFYGALRLHALWHLPIALMSNVLTPLLSCYPRFPRDSFSLLGQVRSRRGKNIASAATEGAKPVRFIVRIVVATLCLIGALAAQTSTSEISGIVHDATGAAIPGTAVRVTQTDTGQVRTAVPSGDGTYMIPNLPIGPYRMEVAKEGFSGFLEPGIVLEVNTNPALPA